MRQALWAALLGFAGALALAPAQAQAQALAQTQTAEDAVLLSSVLEAADARNWSRADALAARAASPVPGVVATWLRLARGAGQWPAYAAFLAAHPDWPRMSVLRREAERRMPAGLPPGAVRRFFAGTPPLTGAGALRLAAALRAQGEAARAELVLSESFRTGSIASAGLAAFAAQEAALVRRGAFARFDAMMWRGRLSQAEAVMPYLTAAQRVLARARLALRRGQRGVDGLIAAVPPALADDPGLAHDRFEWRMRRDRYDDATALLLDRSASAERLGRPEAWAKRRLQLAHRAMRNGNAPLAYRLAAGHWMAADTDFEQLEWFAGWLALRKLGDAGNALRHFTVFRDNVDTPISRGRAGYWLGRAYEALGQADAAAAAYRFAAANQTSYYGQLAAERAGIPASPMLVGGSPLPNWREADFMQRPSGHAVLLFHAAGEPGRVWQFVIALARQESDIGELAAMARMALDLGYFHIAVRVAKIAAGRGSILTEAYYPVTPLATHPGTALPPELVLAVARTESEFNAAAVSPAGARGLMQLMPRTARKVAGDLGLAYSSSRLTSDWRYNADLGKGYLVEQLARFSSLPLVAAAYNAGPHRVERWLLRYGDPRSDTETMLDWIETIPFTETRNYVMRVMEGLHVYRARLGGAAPPIRLTRDLGLQG
ncbi:MAG: lytic transglycosylase domain-containing protein [Pseudomonadota bacterium]